MDSRAKSSTIPQPVRSQKFTEFINGQPCGPDNDPHCDRVDGVVPRDRQHAHAVRHHDVLALSQNAEAGLFQIRTASDGCPPGDLASLDSDLDFPDLSALDEFLDCAQVFSGSNLDIGDRLSLRLSLRATTWQTGYPHTVTLFGTVKNDFVRHDVCLPCGCSFQSGVIVQDGSPLAASRCSHHQRRAKF